MEITPANSIHMLWMVPQFFTIMVAEILFLATGYSFSFTEAPRSMQAVMSACYCLPVHSPDWTNWENESQVLQRLDYKMF